MGHGPGGALSQDERQAGRFLSRFHHGSVANAMPHSIGAQAAFPPPGVSHSPVTRLNHV